MIPSDFATWLLGFTELHGQPPTPVQWLMIKTQLDQVFHKVTSNSLLSDSFLKINDALSEGPICGQSILTTGTVEPVKFRNISITC